MSPPLASPPPGIRLQSHTRWVQTGCYSSRCCVVNDAVSTKGLSIAFISYQHHETEPLPDILWQEHNGSAGKLINGLCMKNFSYPKRNRWVWNRKYYVIRAFWKLVTYWRGSLLCGDTPTRKRSIVLLYTILAARCILATQKKAQRINRWQCKAPQMF